MSPAATRTLNQLHFEDLEPHRFEDLVRQLLYDFRAWSEIEATGRLGSDEGVDIRAVERLRNGAASPTDDSEDEQDNDDPVDVSEQREWLVQCKREKRISPSRLRSILEESLPEPAGPQPYGFILAAACDFSAKSRQAFREVLSARGIQEFVLWGKAEVEDQLFQPKNDHLLFAYFGVSLQVRRRSTRTKLNARLAIKRKLVKLLGELGQPNPERVLIRDAAATDYPRPVDPEAFRAKPRWRYFAFAGHLQPNHIAFVVEEKWAWARFDSSEWDMIERFDNAYHYHPELSSGPQRDSGDRSEEIARRFWYIRVPKPEQALFRVYGFVHYDRIVQVDDIGDTYHEPPHILVDCDQPDQLFDGFRERIESTDHWSPRHLYLDGAKRVHLFPTTFPEIPDEEFLAGPKTGL